MTARRVPSWGRAVTSKKGKKTMENRIQLINTYLAFIGSGFRVLEDGRTLARCINGAWLVKGFRNTDDLVRFVLTLRG